MALNLSDLQKSLSNYLAAVKIETDAEPATFADVANPWQKTAIQAIAPAVESLVVPKRKSAPEPTVRRCWWVRPRGHSKTADAALLVAWILAFSRRRRRGLWIAADKDQGCEGLDSVSTLCRHNSWLASLLTIRADRIENERTGSVMHFTTSDVSSAFGKKDYDVFALDEVTHWRTNGEDLWTAIYSAAGKRKNAIVFALMNAGHSGTWQERLRNTAATDPNWAFDELGDCVASWIDLGQLRDQQRYLPQTAFDRLWRNRWSSSLGDALLPEHVERAFLDELQPMHGAEQGWAFVLGCDLGLTRDFSACITLGVPMNPRTAAVIRLADAKLWRPPPGGKVDLLAVQKHVLEQDAKFDLSAVVLDAWQAEHLGQVLELSTRHRRRSDRKRFWTQSWVQTIQPTSAALREQAHLVIESFTDNRLRLYPYAPLKSDLLALRAEERPTGGIRLVSPRTIETGHGDSYSAFALALVVAHKLATKRRRIMLGNMLEPKATPLQRTMSDLESLRSHEQWLTEQGDGHDAPFRELMFRFGRTNSPFPFS